jgi:hypothetical protein
MKKFSLPRTFYNWTSIAGATLALISLFMIIFLFVISLVFDQGGSYLGLLVFIVLPVFLVIGLIFIPIGMYFQHRKARKIKLTPEKTWPVFDLNQKPTRNATMIFGFGSLFFLLLSAVGSYEAFHFTESVEFCGTICHKVMKPEYVAYQHSSHARVACVDCHVGSGADWYVRSKLAGLYQVYAVMAGVYPKPIPTPVRNLRPARETCEECHWPEQFYGRKLVIERHFLPDEENSEWDIYLQMKIGPKHRAHGLQEGIHWHINPDVKVEYIAADYERQIIPWVRYTNLSTGEVQIFEDEDNKIPDSDLAGYEIRTMDCMDCHNRPSHDYKTPVRFINHAITAGLVPRELPDIKYLAMEILGRDYPTTDSAMRSIESEINEYYAMMYDDIYTDNYSMIAHAISGIQSEFGKNVFPEMKVKWNVYHNNIGHLEFNGCFRCHNDKHTTRKGRTISMDCNLCHTIIGQGLADTLRVGSIFDQFEFIHPNDPKQAWKDKFCVDCHWDLYQQ